MRYVGEGEAARALKLVLQVLIGGTAELLAEALVLGEAGGIDRGTLLDVDRRDPWSARASSRTRASR